MPNEILVTIMAKGDPVKVRAAFESAFEYAAKGLLVVAPEDPLLQETWDPRITVREVPWQGFGPTRTAMNNIAVDMGLPWILLLDGDDTIKSGCQLPPLDDPDIHGFEIPIRLVKASGEILTWFRTHLVRADKAWNFGPWPVHEGICCDHPVRVERWMDLVYLSGFSSGTPARFLKDAQALTDYLLLHPDDPRASFYLAQSLRDAGALGLSYEKYLVRSKLSGGHTLEPWWSLFEASRLLLRVGAPPEVVVASYMHCAKADPTRAEPWWDLYNYFTALEEHEKAGACKAKAWKMDWPEQYLFVDADAYHPNKRP